MTTADIVIIGGGIVGANIAYQLALRGVTRVTLLEREEVASGSSGRATGGLRQQFADELDIRFAVEGVRFYKQFTSDSAVVTTRPPSRFYQYGYLFLVTAPESWRNMQGYVALQQSLGVPTQLLGAAEVQQRVPQLIVEDIVGATFCATDGYSDPGAMARALIDAARAQGVTIHTHTPALAIAVKQGKVRAVHTPQETIHTPLVINAAGAHAAFVARLAGIDDLPVYPLRRQLYLTEPFADLPAEVPMVVDLETGFHFRRRGEAVVLAMPRTPSEEEERLNRELASEAFTLPIDEALWPLVQAEIRRRCPTLAGARIAHTWSGLYEMTPDEHPILGPTEIEGFWCACGFSGHGFMHSPMAAKLLAELILDGASATLPIEQFSSGRFRNGTLLPVTRLL